MFCQQCGTELLNNEKFCPNCGTPQGNTKYCQYCGEAVDSDCIICPKCGKQIGQVKVDPPPQPQVVINNNNTNTNTNVNHNQNYNPGGNGYLYKSKLVALLLCFFLGGLGVHRFYVGKFGTGVIWLFTVGLFGFGWLIDFIMILIGGFRDKANMPLK